MSVPDITLAICSNRAERVVTCCHANLTALRATDDFLLVIDTRETPHTCALMSEWGCRGRIIVNGANRGLSYSRNVALGQCRTKHIVFIDDDVVIDRVAVEAIRRAFADGCEVVGVRVLGPRAFVQTPFYITEGQYHYLGIHVPGLTARTWGACMGVDATFARVNQLRFRDELGRWGAGLASGDDTTFVADMKRFGAREAFLDSISVHHEFDQKRLSLRYMLRRTFWQGRSEVRRGTLWHGALKEWKRFTFRSCKVAPQWFHAAAYMAVFWSGAATEGVITWVNRLFAEQLVSKGSPESNS
jgi:glycosyltransferase involved in cell wall biosynthesis